MVFIIPWIVFVLAPSPILGTLSNEQVDLSQHIYNVAVKEGIDPIRLLKLANCESRISKSAIGDYQIETDTYLSRGLFQFQKSTFLGFSKLYGLKLEWLNPHHQTELAARIISKEKNGWKHWLNCGRASGYK